MFKLLCLMATISLVLIIIGLHFENYFVAGYGGGIILVVQFFMGVHLARVKAINEARWTREIQQNELFEQL